MTDSERIAKLERQLQIWDFKVWQEELCGTWHCEIYSPWGDGPLRIDAARSEPLFAGMRSTVLYNLNRKIAAIVDRLMEVKRESGEVAFCGWCGGTPCQCVGRCDVCGRSTGRYADELCDDCKGGAQ